jgi:hypothetical protein
MLYEIASGRLTELSISVQAPRWSADGKYLMGLSGDEEQPSIHIYRTDTWVCTQQIRIPREYYDKVVAWDWAHWLQSDPPMTVDSLGRQKDSQISGDLNQGRMWGLSIGASAATSISCAGRN